MINTIDDAVPELPTKTYQFLIPSFFEGSSTFQVSPTSNIRTITILDDECECIDRGLISDYYALPWREVLESFNTQILFTLGVTNCVIMIN